MDDRKGYGVAIRRKDGSEFLATAEKGILPAVWTLSQRRFAVEYKRELAAHGLNARVARVLFRNVQIEPAVSRG